MPDSIGEMLSEAYSATHDLIKDPKLGSVVRHGLLLSYGPPIAEPDLLLLTFQGGGACPEMQDTWPPSLLYRDDPHKFGKTLRRFCRETGLSTSLESSTMALPAVFPQAPSTEAGLWTRKTGPRSVWRRHSTDWVNRLTDAIRPKVVIVFGTKASEAFDIRWEKQRHADMRGSLTFGVSTFRGAPAVFCQHLSQGWSLSEVRRSFEHAKRLVSRLST